MKTAVQLGFALAMAAGAVHADTLALVAADSTMNETAVQTAMMATGKFTAVDIIDTQLSTPTIDVLHSYTDVLVWTAAAPADKVALGDVLASYFDQGGRLTIANYAFSHITPNPTSVFVLPDPELGGKIMTPPYAGLTNVGVNGDVSGTITPIVTGDPIFTGLDLTTTFYFENQYFAHPGLATGATLLAADGTGSGAIDLIARSQNGVVNLNFYPGGMGGNELGLNNPAFFTLLANSFIPVKPDPPADPPAPPVANPGGPYSFCTESKPWLLDGSHSTDPELGKSDPGKTPDSIIQYAWDLNGSGTFTDATGPQPDVTAFYTHLGPGTYTAQLRVTASTAASFPSSGLANLTGTASTQVVVNSACACITGLTAAVTTSGDIRLTWPKAATDHYNIYRSTTSGSGYALAGKRPGWSTDFVDESAAPGHTYFYVVREAGVTGAETCQSNEASATLAPDTTAPTTTGRVVPEPNSKGWNHSNVAVVFYAQDNPGGSGVKQINISWSGAETGSRVAAGRAAYIPLTTEGTTTVTYFSTDQAGNSETAKTLVVMIDKTDPTATATVDPAPDATGVSHTNVTVTFTGTDSLSGLGSCTGPVTLSAGGAHTATGVCRDNAGNVSARVTKTVKFDSAGPAITGAPRQCILWPNNNLVTVAKLKATQATTFTVTGTSNEPPDAGVDDIVITGTGLDPRVVQLRATRLDSGNGRIYTVTANATNTLIGDRFQ